MNRFRTIIFNTGRLYQPADHEFPGQTIIARLTVITTHAGKTGKTGDGIQFIDFSRGINGAFLLSDEQARACERSAAEMERIMMHAYDHNQCYDARLSWDDKEQLCKEYARLKNRPKDTTIGDVFESAPKRTVPLDHLVRVLTDHIATLESCGFGGEGDIEGADAVDAVNGHFEALRDALAAVRAVRR